MKVDRTTVKHWGRWVATFVGFPLAGVAARAMAGDVDAPAAAVLGGLIGGAVLGITQATIGGVGHGARLRWAGATGVGLAVGLGIGAAAADYRTDAASLVAMGAICGVTVGIAQAVSIPLVALDRALWMLATPALWAIGWFITSQVIVDADRHHAVFGSSGALAVSALAGVLVARWRSPMSAALDPAAGSDDRMAA